MYDKYFSFGVGIFYQSHFDLFVKFMELEINVFFRYSMVLLLSLFLEIEWK